MDGLERGELDDRMTIAGSAGWALRRALLPWRSFLEEVGDMVLLTARTISSALRPPYPYGGEFVSQFIFVLRICWLPLLVSTFALSYGAPGLQASNFLAIFGALDRLGGLFVLAVVREIGPIITGLMLATGLFNIYAILFGLFGGLLADIVNHQPLGPFWVTFFANTSTTDLWGSTLKTTVFGAIIAIVACYKGMTASGGAEGVGRAVNQSVVISFLVFGAFNYAFTQMLLATHPNILVIR